MTNIIRNTASFALSIVKDYVSKGDTVVDATCGNGFDTLALAKMTGKNGKVYGFDVSGLAISATMDLLINNEAEADIELIYNGHEEMDLHINEKPAAVCFNLGYLPGEDKTKTTKKETTLIAVRKALDMIKTDGIVSIVMYPGHEEGKAERDMLLEWAEKLSKQKYHAAYINMINQPDNAPEILLITKKL